MDEQRDSRGQAAKILAAIVVFAIVLIYAPLALAGMESVLFHTDNIEQVCRRIGVHEALESIYDSTVFRIFK
jgi:hypothetical protein